MNLPRPAGRSVRTVRTAISFALGGSVRFGTVSFAVTVGPIVHLFLDRMTFTPPARPETTPAPGTVEAL